MSIRVRRKFLPYVTAATYDALRQPAERWTGNNVYQNATYDIRGRLSGANVIGPGSTHLYGRSYGWDGMGNLNAIAVWENSTGGVPRQLLNFAYDDCDRLTHAWTGGANQTAPYNEWHGYDTISNLTSKTDMVLGYGANANGTGAGPH